MIDFLIAMSPVIAIWAMLLGPVLYMGVRGVLRFLMRALTKTKAELSKGADVSRWSAASVRRD